MALSWDFSAKIVPLVIGITALIASGVSLFNDLCRKPETGMESLVDQTIHEVERQISAGGGSGGAAAADQKIHMDLTSETGHLPLNVIINAGGALLRLSARVHGDHGDHRPHSHGRALRGVLHALREQRALAAGDHYATVLVIVITFVFEHIMHIPWPRPCWAMVPELKSIIPSLS